MPAACPQERLDAAVKRARLLEADNAELRRQKAQARCCLLAWWGVLGPGGRARHAAS